jgi:hypothetical protein
MKKQRNLDEQNWRAQGLTVKSASHEVDIQKNSDAVRKMEALEGELDQFDFSSDSCQTNSIVQKTGPLKGI